MAKEHKIAFISTSLPGGVDKNLEVQLRIAKELFDETFFIDIFSSAGVSPCRNLIGILLKTPKVRKKIGEILYEIRPSVMQIHYQSYIPWIPLRYPSLIFIHGLPSGRLAFLVYHILVDAIKRSVGVVFVSEQLKNDFEKKIGHKVNNCWVIHDPIDTELFRPVENPDKNLVVTCGRLAKAKRMEFFLYSAKILSSKFPKFRFLIVGDGPEREKLERLTFKMNLGNKVEFLGFRDDWHKILPLCGVFVLTSAYEGFGRVVAEAMACNVPVVTTALGGPQEILAKSGGLIVPSNPQKIAEAIEKVSLDEEYRASIITNARERVIEKYSHIVFSGKMRSLYSQLMEDLENKKVLRHV